MQSGCDLDNLHPETSQAVRMQQHAETEEPLLPESQDLLDLFSAFLTALSLHYAHNGTLSPADLRLLAPTIARTWGKRAVSTEDVQRALGVLHDGSSEHHLHLSDYGGSKICVELPDHVHVRTSSNSAGIPSRAIDEDKLNAAFATNLRRLHAAWSTLPPTSPAPFLPSLPLLPIHPCASRAQHAPFHAKGRRRLSEFKASAAAASLRSKENRPLSSSKPARPPVADRRRLLLDRIKAKSALQATLPPETTPAQLARQAALDRLPHLVRVLAHLSPSSAPLHSSSPQQTKTRTTVLMPALLDHLRSNLSHPVSATEGYEAVEALVAIAPEWVEIVCMGGVRGVVVKRGGYVGGVELAGRIEDARVGERPGGV